MTPNIPVGASQQSDLWVAASQKISFVGVEVLWSYVWCTVYEIVKF